MKSIILDRTIINFLYNFFVIAFWIYTFYFLANLSLNLFANDGNIGLLNSNPHYSDGFPLPVSVKINIPDSIVTYKDESGNMQDRYYPTSIGFDHRYPPIHSDKDVLENIIKI